MAAFKLTVKQAKRLDELAQAFESAKQELAEYLDEIASEWENALSERSEKWQESDAGATATERTELVRNWFDELPGEGEPAIDAEALSEPLAA